jgi:16S rRNA (guanine966-N2)-methyltransferase
MDALAYLDAADSVYDLVFLDPPFADDLLDATLARLCERGALASGGLVYVERPKGTSLNLPTGLEVLKEKTAGNVACALYRRS